MLGSAGWWKVSITCGSGRPHRRPKAAKRAGSRSWPGKTITPCRCSAASTCAKISVASGRTRSTPAMRAPSTGERGSTSTPGAPPSDPGREEPAVHANRLAGHERCGIGGEVNRGARQLAHFAEAPHRRARHGARLALRAPLVAVQLGQEKARSDGIHAHAASRPFRGEFFRDAHETRLADAVEGDPRPAAIRREGGDVDDRP